MQETRNIFFAAVTSRLRGHLLDFHRLYSYPKIPEPTFGKKVVLDSGAYGLLTQNRYFTKNMIYDLAEFHINIDNINEYIVVAPDHPGNPQKSISNFMLYKEICDVNIMPCFHFTNESFNVNEFLYQYNIYKKYCDFEFAFIAEKKATKTSCIDEKKVKAENAFMRKYLPEKCFMHYFSSGKSLLGIKIMCSMPYVTLDTTGWQYDAMSKHVMLRKYNIQHTDDYVKNCINILEKIYFVANGGFPC